MKIKKKNWAFSLLKMSRLERISSLLLLSICVILSAILYIRKQKQKEVFISHIKPLALAENYNYADVSSTTFNELHPYPFDPNTLDSIGFVELGLREKTIKMICNYRRKGGHFYKPEDFAKVWTLSKQEFDQLKDFIKVVSYGSPSKSSYQAIQHIDWNTIDSASLTRVNGIGPYIAHKLITYRDLLGGFINCNQLKEAYNLKDSLFNYINSISSFDPNNIKKLTINSISELELAKHPYIGDKMAKNILLLRSSFKKFDKIEQLKQVPLMNEEKYRKIAPYIQL
jgi:competence protein ComEA